MSELDLNAEISIETDDDGNPRAYLKHPLDIDTGTGTVPLTYHVIDTEGEITLTESGFTVRTADEEDIDIFENGLYVD